METINELDLELYTDNFNPLHHEGGDSGFSITCLTSFISIHSTTRVETLDPNMDPEAARDFNPLHHEGGDGKGYGITAR